MGRSISGRLKELDGLKTVFSKGAANKKRRLLRALSRTEILEPDDLILYHETLMFMRAFPDNRDLLDASEAELQRFIDRVERCKEEYDGELPGELVDSGIAGTPYYYSYGFPMVSWFVDRFGDDLDIDWEAYDEREDDVLSTVLTPIVSWLETVATDDEAYTVQEWFEAARGKRKIGFLRWLVERLKASDLSPLFEDAMYDEMELMTCWQLGSGPGSRTLARYPVDRYYYHTEPMRGRTEDFRKEVRRPFKRIAPVGRRRGRTLIDLARGALSLRAREFYGITIASDKEVYEADVGRGLKIFLFGLLLERRLPIETEYGALLVKNGVPIGYAFGSIMLDQVLIGVNVFPTYRQGESAFIFEQFARILYSYCGCRSFQVEAYQQGHENEEGLSAGSFWFYRKLGFRSINPKVRALADEEEARLRKGRGRRTEKRMLRRLARSDTLLHMDKSRPIEKPSISESKIGLAASRHIEERFGGDRKRAQLTCAREAVRILGIKDFKQWSETERDVFAQLSPLTVILPGIKKWSAADKRSFAKALRSKGSARELGYARRVAKHLPFRRALDALSKT